MMIRFLGIMSLTDKYPSATKIIQTQIWNWALGVHGFVLILDAANQIRSSSCGLQPDFVSTYLIMFKFVDFILKCCALLSHSF